MADDFTEQLNAVLGNPEAMGQIMSIARALTCLLYTSDAADE